MGEYFLKYFVSFRLEKNRWELRKLELWLAWKYDHSLGSTQKPKSHSHSCLENMTADKLFFPFILFSVVKIEQTTNTLIIIIIKQAEY